MNKIMCKRCVLHSSIPQVSLDEEQVCNLCKEYDENSRYQPKIERYLEKQMQAIFEKRGQGMYDAAVMFSGGKDSTMLLKMAKEKYGLRVLAISVMHPLVNQTASQNMEQVAAALGVDLIKIHIQEDVYKKVMKQGLLYGDNYDLTEFVGCQVCNFLFKWVIIKVAMSMGIPNVLEGNDKSQSPAYLAEGYKFDLDKPYGKLHDLVRDALGGEYDNSIYGCDSNWLKQRKFPNLISPFTFIEYEYKDNFKKIDALGINSKKYRSLITNCDAVPFFSYLSIKKYDCVSYIKHFANEIRRGYPNMSQLSLDETTDSMVLERKTMSEILEEFKQIILYVAEKGLTEETMTSTHYRTVLDLAPTFYAVYGEKVSDSMLKQILKISYYMNYFEISPDQI